MFCQRFVAFGTMLVGVAGLLIAPKYTAKALVMVEPQQADFVAAAGPRTVDQSAIDTQVTMLASSDHLRRVLGSLSEAGRVPAPGSGTELNRRQSVEAGALSFEDFERRLKVFQERSSRIIAVTFTSSDPGLAAAVANRAVDLFVESQTELKSAHWRGELARIAGRIAELKSETERTSAAVQKVLQQRSGGDRDGGTPLRELEREAAVNGQLYDILIRRQKEIRDGQELVAPDVRSIARAAAPDTPSTPNALLFMFPALVIFMIGGSTLAVLLEQLDRGLRSERDVQSALGVPCIGLVPRLRRRDALRPHEHLHTQSFAVYTEAIRSVATTLWMSDPRNASKAVLISSSIPGEGKTTLAVSLCTFVASLGRRTLLIDLDCRHPATLRELGGEAKLGILDIFMHGRRPKDVVRHIPDLAFDHLPMAACPRDPLELAEGDQMRRLLSELWSDYDCVVIDSAPVMGISETRLFASMVDKVVFVVKWGETRREVAQTALSLLSGSRDQQRSNLVGVVVTQVDLKKHALYGYGDVGESFIRHRNYYSSAVNHRVSSGKTQRIGGQSRGQRNPSLPC